MWCAYEGRSPKTVWRADKTAKNILFSITILVMIFSPLPSKSSAFLWHVSDFSYKAIQRKYFIKALSNRSLVVPLQNRSLANEI
tara:strand:- start:380 stop:631 length:252 start_codon:yes stop_codon:yes gene_type:complete